MTHHYILDENFNPVPCYDLITWAEWLETSNRVVARTRVGDLGVSTVFLGLDHRFGDEGEPILWETMIFGKHMGGAEVDMWRYTNLDDAIRGHENAVKLCTEGKYDQNTRLSTESNLLLGSSNGDAISD